MEPERSPVLSVIINNYNYGAFLRRAIRSALEQTGVASEVIVVDDGSRDESRDVIAEFGNDIVPVLKANGGQASALNAGVRAARGSYLSFLDADDWFLPGKLASVVAAFAADPGSGLVYHRLQPTGPGDLPAFRPIPRTLCSGDLAPLMARTAGCWPFPMTSAISVSREIWDRAGDIPETLRISADAWLVGIHPFLTRVTALPRVLGGYRIHKNGWYRAEDSPVMLRRRMAHWRESVLLTNGFLEAEGLPWRLDLSQHHAYRTAKARLSGAGPLDRLRLLAAGLHDAAEPHLARRARDAARAAWQVPWPRHAAPLPGGTP